MKTYKHKTLGWIAQQQSEGDNKYVVGNSFRFPEELLINSQDREEVVEKNWKEKARDEYELLQDRIETSMIEDFKEAIEKHAPKQKKFSESDLREFARKKLTDLPYNRVVEGMIIFLKEHNLLSSDE